MKIINKQFIKVVNYFNKLQENLVPNLLRIRQFPPRIGPRMSLACELCWLMLVRKQVNFRCIALHTWEIFSVKYEEIISCHKWFLTEVFTPVLPVVYYILSKTYIWFYSYMCRRDIICKLLLNYNSIQCSVSWVLSVAIKDVYLILLVCVDVKSFVNY